MRAPEDEIKTAKKTRQDCFGPQLLRATHAFVYVVKALTVPATGTTEASKCPLQHDEDLPTMTGRVNDQVPFSHDISFLTKKRFIMTRRDSCRKSKGSGRSRRNRVSDPNIYPYSSHPQGTAIPSSAPRRASVASYTTQPYPHRPNPSRDPQKQAHAGHPRPPHPSRPIESHEPFLKDDEDLRLKARQYSDVAATGFTVANKDKSGANNACAPLPLPNGGIVDNGTSAIAAYGRTKGGSVSGKVPDIMFSPPCELNGAALRDVEWSRMVPRPAVKEINEADGGFRLSELKSFVPEIPAPPERMRKH